MDPEQERRAAAAEAAAPVAAAPQPTPEQGTNGRAAPLDHATRTMLGGEGTAAHTPGAPLDNRRLAHAAVLEQMAHGATYNNGSCANAEDDADGQDRRKMLVANGYDPEPQLVPRPQRDADGDLSARRRSARRPTGRFAVRSPIPTTSAPTSIPCRSATTSTRRTSS